MFSTAPKVIFQVLALCLFLVWLPAVSGAEVYLIQPGPGDNAGGDGGSQEAGKDCFVSQFHPGSNFNQYNLVSGRNSGTQDDPGLGGNSRTYIQFDVYNLTASVRRVLLLMRAFNTGGYAAHGSLAAYQVLGEWGETCLTWNNQPAVSDQVAALSPVEAAGGWVELDITDTYLLWKQGWPNNGLMLDTQGSDGDATCTRNGEEACRPGEYHSSDSDRAELRPVLMIQPYFDPAPGAYSDQDLSGTWRFASGPISSLTLDDQGRVTALSPSYAGLRTLWASRVFTTTEGKIRGMLRWANLSGERFDLALLGSFISKEALVLTMDGARSSAAVGSLGEINQTVTGVRP